MTICITTFNPEQLVFACDQLTYHWKNNFLEDFFNGKIKFDHTNLKTYIKRVEKSEPKIIQLNSHMAIMRGGDVKLNSVVEDLKKANIKQQIIQRLKQLNITPSIWECAIGQFTKNKCCVEFISYHNGIIKTEQHIIGQTINSLSQEIVDIFQKEYATNLFFAETNTEKIRILNQFFNKITELYDGLAGGTPIIAIINREGFKWLQQ